jgi:hypothetical protein
MIRQQVGLQPAQNSADWVSAEIIVTVRFEQNEFCS